MPKVAVTVLPPQNLDVMPQSTMAWQEDQCPSMTKMLWHLMSQHKEKILQHDSQCYGTPRAKSNAAQVDCCCIDSS